MMDIKEAYDIAKKGAEHYKLGEVKDLGDRWVFCFYKRDSHGLLCPQSPNVTVNKETGEMGSLAIPPLENLKLIKSAKTIEFEAEP